MNGNTKSKRDQRKQQALAYHKAGHEVQKIAQMLGVSERTITRYLSGELSDRRVNGKGRPKKHTERCEVCGSLSKTRLPVVEGRCTRKRCQKVAGYQVATRYALGIDPGIANCGYAVVARNKRGQFRVLDAGCIKQGAEVTDSHACRLLAIAEKTEALLVQYAPISVLAVENIFFNKNVTSAISTGQVIGAVSVVGARHLVKVLSINPQKAKAAIGAGGQANKAQVKSFVQKLCEMETSINSDHEADAIVIAMAALLVEK